MTVETRIYNGSALVATLTGSSVQINYVSGSTDVLKYQNTVINKIESDASQAGDLEITVVDGDNWELRNARVTTSASFETQLDWTMSGSDLVLKAEYPSWTYSTATWFLSDEDGPAVPLKVVVRRV